MNIFKYRSGSKRDIKLLANNQFYSASTDSLNDILEAKVIIDGKSFELLDIMLNKIDTSKNNSFLEVLNNFRLTTKKFGIYSLSQTYKNELLWAYYANSHKGFCIEYNFDIFKKYQLNDESLCEVKYQNNLPIITINDIHNNQKLVQKLLGTKSSNWKHEQEVRFITGVHGIFHYYNRSVKAIYFGYHSSSKDMKLIMRVLRGRGVKYYKIHPKTDLYELERKEILDIYVNYKPQKNKNIKRFIPDYDGNTRPYQLLIEKAIDIFLLEKLHKEILDVYISTDKSTKENPVFFITYKDKIRKMTVNYWISKEEILQQS